MKVTALDESRGLAVIAEGVDILDLEAFARSA
jgi:hypothetical protein